MTDLELLEGYDQFFDNEDKWVKEYFAVDVLGYSVSPFSDKAVRWCMAGAVDKCCLVNSDESVRLFHLLIDSRAMEVRKECYKTLSILNDSNSFSGIKQFIKEVIEEHK